MAYVVHNVQVGDAIYATTTNEQDAQILANEQAIEALGQRVEVIETDVGDISQIETDVSALQTNVGTLQTDLATMQTTVAGKMSEPATEGTSGQVLTTDGNGNRTWTTVEGGGPSIDIDDTLTQQGEAADAKAAGDALATKLAKPVTEGTNGQVLVANGQGGVSWVDGYTPMTTTDIDEAVQT